MAITTSRSPATGRNPPIVRTSKTARYALHAALEMALAGDKPVTVAGGEGLRTDVRSGRPSRPWVPLRARRGTPRASPR